MMNYYKFFLAIHSSVNQNFAHLIGSSFEVFGTKLRLKQKTVLLKKNCIKKPKTYFQKRTKKYCRCSTG